MEETIKVNISRLPIVIGQNGQTKANISKKTNTLIDINSKTGDVVISSDKSYYGIYVAKKIIDAISKGFSPQNALQLLNDNVALEIIDIRDYVDNIRNREKIAQIKGRVIGRNGKVKELIEKKQKCVLSIYGYYIGIIGSENQLKKTRDIIEKILQGASHTTVFKMLKSDIYTDKKSFKNSQDTPIDDIFFDE